MNRRSALSCLALGSLVAGSGWLAGCATVTSDPSGHDEGRAPDGARGPGAPQTDIALDPTRLEVVMHALGQVGIPYVSGGTSPYQGFDCSGLVFYAYRQGARMVLPRTAFEQAQVGQPAEEAGLWPADLLFYNTLGRPFSHVGIYIGEDRFVHAPSSRGVVRVEPMRASYWRERFNGARRVVGSGA